MRALEGFVGKITEYGATDQYHFEVAGDRIQNWYFDSLTPDQNSSWTLTGPFGTVANRTFGSSDGYNIDHGSVILKLAPGGYDLAIRGNPRTLPTYAFNLTPLSSAALITPGAAVTGTLFPGNASRLYQFPGKAGDKVQVRLLATNLPSVSVRLVDPFGQVLDQTSQTGSIQHLQADGNYTVLVEGYIPNLNPGSFGLNVVPLGNTPSFPDGETLVLGQHYRYTNNAPFTNVYRFHLDAPTQIAFAPNTPNSQVRVEWRGPQGILDSRRLIDDEWVVRATPEGDYAVQVWSTVSGAPQTVAFTFQNLANAPLLAADGQTRRATNSPASDDTFVRVNLTAGDRIYSQVQAVSRSDYGVAWRWFDPFGNPLRHPSGSLVEAGNGDIGTFTTPFTGTYFLGFGSYVYETPAEITRSYALIPVTHRQLDLALGTEYSGKIEMPGQILTHRFTLSEPTQVVMDIQTNTLAYWRLDGPSGTVWNPRFNNDSLWVQELIPGDYQVVVYANGSDTPGYRFALRNLGSGPSIALSETNTVTLPNTSSHIQHVDLVAGQPFYTRAISQSGFNTYGTAYWTLLDPALRIVWDTSFRDLGVITPTVSGTYTLLINGASGDSGASGTATYVFLPVQNTTEDIQINTRVAGSLQQPGQQRTYRFNLAQPTRISIDPIAADGIRFNLSGPAGVVVDDALWADRWWQYDLPAGSYTFTLRSDGRETPSYHFQVLTPDDAVAVLPDTTQSISFPSASSTRFARIHLVAGQRIRVEVDPASGFSAGYRPGWMLLSPSGTQLGFNNNSVTEAPVTGTYDLMIGGNLGQPVVPATAMVRVTLAPISNASLLLGQTITGEINPAGEVDRFAFTLDAPHRVSIDGLDYGNRQFLLAGPTGEVVNDNFGADRWWTYLLPPGAYDFRAFANQANTGGYSFRIIDLEAGTPIPFGVTQTATLAPGSSTVSRPLILAQGQTATFQPIARTGFTQNPGWSLVDPAGRRVWESDATSPRTFKAVLPGKHVLLIGGPISQSATNGTVQFQVMDGGTNAPTPWIGKPLSIGAVITGTLEATNLNRFTGLYNSGVDNDGKPLPPGTVDPHYTVLASAEPVTPVPPRPALVIEGHPAWLAADTASGWLGPIHPGTANVAAGAYRYETRFQVTGANPESASLRIGVATDDQLLDVLLNGQSAGYSKVGYGSFAPEFNLAGGFVAGDNRLEFIWANNGGPGGFRVRYTDAQAHSYTFSTTTTRYLHLDALNAQPVLVTLRNRERTILDAVPLSTIDAPGFPASVLVLEPGDYQLTVAGSSETYAFRLVDLEAAPIVAVDADLALVQDPALQSGVFRFFGTAGERMAWAGAPNTSFSTRPAYWLGTPTGAALSSTYTDTYNEFTLPATGYYFGYTTVRTSDTATMGTVHFRLASHRIDSRVALSIGQVYDGQVPGPGGYAEYTFTLTEPRQLLIDTMADNNHPQGFVSLFRPEGPVFTSYNLSGTDQLQLTAGSYTLRFQSSGAATPRFRFALRDLADAQSLALNTPVTGTNAPANRAALYKFDVQSGDIYLMQGLGYSGYEPSGGPYAEVYYPYGGGWDGPRLNGYTDRLVFPQAGAHVLSVSALSDATNTAGNHQFILWKVIDRTRPLALGEVVDGRIEMPRQQQAFQLTTSTPRLVLLDNIGSGGNIEARLQTSSGLVLQTQLESIEDYDRAQLKLLPTGTSTLTLQGGGLATNRILFRVLDATEGTPLTLGVNAPQSFADNETRIFRFQGLTGDRLYYRSLGSVGFNGTPGARLFGPRGEVLFDHDVRFDRDVFVLPHTGAYYFVINGRALSGSEKGVVNFGFHTVPPTSTLPLFGTATGPDLVVDSVSVTPETQQSGGTVDLAWTTRNAGNAPATNHFSDRVVVRNASGLALAVRSAGGNTPPLPPGATLNRSVSVRLPDGAQSAGPLQVVVTADAGNSNAEVNEAGTGESNNARTTSLTGTLAPYPDLQLVALTAQPAAGWTPALPVTISWTTTNTGAARAAGPWTELVIVSNTTRHVVLATISTNFPESGLEASSAASRSVALTLPNSADVYGSLAVWVQLDPINGVPEYNANDTAEQNNTAAIAIVGGADLSIDSVIAPANITPGVAFPLVYVLRNNGNVTLTGRWQETITLTASPDAPGETYVGSSSTTASLPPGSTLRVTNSFTIPRTGVAGSYRFRVRTDSGDVIAEGNESNNDAYSTDSTTIPSVLSLVMGQPSIHESDTRPVSASISRNGSTAHALTVSLVANLPDRAAVPASFVIPVGASSTSFPIQPLPDGLITGPLDLGVTASAAAFAPSSATVTVLDDDFAQLSLTLSTNRAVEGTLVQARVTRYPVDGSPLTVSLGSTDPFRVSVPPAIVIPAGSDSVTFPVPTTALPRLQGPTAAILTASSAGYAQANAALEVRDAVVPSVTLTVTPRIFPKSAGASAAVGTLTRAGALDQPVLLRLSKTGDAPINFPTTVTIPANSEAVTFNIGVTGDSLVTGNRTAVLAGQVLDFTGSTPIGEVSPDLITVTDDNSPTLGLTFGMPVVSEGRSNATTATVTRNTPGAEALVVTLSSGDVTALVLPPSVTIPKGATAFTFPVSTATDNQPTGTRPVTATATANGFNPAQAAISVSDIDLPDLVAAAITAPTSASTGESITVSWVVTNNGLSDADGFWFDRIYISPRADGVGGQVIGTRFHDGGLPLHGRYTNSTTVTLPNVASDFYLLVVVDETGRVNDGSKLNNRLATSTALRVKPSYTATVSADVSDAPANTPIQLTGRAYHPSDNSPAARVPVLVRINSRGTSRSFEVFSDAKGELSYTFQPLANEAGRFTARADHPSVADATPQASFTLYGTRFDPPSQQLRVFPQTPVTNTVHLVNLGDTPLQGATFTPEGLPSFVHITFNPETNGIPASDETLISYTVVADPIGTAATTQCRIKATTPEGAVSYLSLLLSITPQTPQLTSTPAVLEDGVLRGQQKTVRFQIGNYGGVATGPIQVQLPSLPWLSLISPSPLPSLSPGDTTTVELRLAPAANVPLALTTGSVLVDAGNASLSVPFRFRTLSDAKGDVRVEVSDDYTYYVEGAPKVAGATVSLSDPVTGDNIANGKTGDDGTILFSNVPEGTFQLRVSAAQHNNYAAPLTVVPGSLNEVRVFIDRQTVSYKWTVVPTTVEDRYRVVLEPVFETEVPIPSIVCENPNVMPFVSPGVPTRINLKFRNVGLVAAEQFQIDPIFTKDWDVEPLVKYIDVFPAKSEMSIPFIVKRHVAGTVPTRRQARLQGADSCNEYPVLQARFSWICGEDRRWHGLSLEFEPVEVECNPGDLLAQIAQCVGGNALDSFDDFDFREAVSGCLQESACDIAMQIAACSRNNCLVGLVNLACGLESGSIAGAVGGAVTTGLNCSCLIPSLPPVPPSPGPRFSPPGISITYASGGGSPSFPTIVIPSFEYTPVDCTPGLHPTSNGRNQRSGAKPAGATDPGAVCARVRLRLEQEIAISRNAFAGTLEIDNSDPTTPVTEVKLELDLRDDQNQPANERFGIRGPDVTNISDFSGTGTVAPASSASGRYQFVPTRDAAKDGPRVYSFGGTLSYKISGTQVTIPLLAQRLTVYPDPFLRLAYFLQRDVLGDDPFTDPIEASEPFVLGLRVQNLGKGAARNFRVAAAQPKIIENEKGLLIDFKLIGTRVGGEAATPSFNVNLGDIAPGRAQVAEFFMTSSLQGKFIEFNADFQHVDDLGSPRTSLIDGVEIHELTHVVRAEPPADGVPDFLANDVPDPDNLPDTLYLSDGTVAPVQLASRTATDRAVTPSAFSVQLTADMPSGWCYLRMPDPGAAYRLVRVTRSDGKVLRLGDNVWTSNRSFPAALAGARYENLLHLLDFNGTGRYTLLYAPANAPAPTLVSIGSNVVPNVNQAVDAVELVFDQPMDTDSFVPDAFRLEVEGTRVPLPVGFLPVVVNPTTVRLTGLASVTAVDNAYRFVVNPQRLLSYAGTQLAKGGEVSWIKGTLRPVLQSAVFDGPSLRSTAVDAIDLQFSSEVDPGHFDPSLLVLVRDQAAVQFPTPPAVSAVSPTRLRISGLSSVTAIEGFYQFTLNGRGFQSPGGSPGAGQVVTEWTTLIGGPRVTAVEAVATNPRNIVVPSLYVDFGRPIVASSFDRTDITLTRDGGTNLVTSDVTVQRLTETRFLITGFNWVSGIAGNYTLTVSANQVSDALGHTGSGSASSSWSLILGKPAAPTAFQLVNDTGVSASDGITSTRLLNLAGTVTRDDVTVRIRDESSQRDVGEARRTGLSFTASYLVPANGPRHLAAYCVDIAGNVSTSVRIEVNSDSTAPGAQFTEVTPNPRPTALSDLAVLFDEAMDVTSVTPLQFSLTRNGGTNLLGATVRTVGIDAKTVSLQGLASLTAGTGVYTLALDLTNVRDLAGNGGSGVLTTVWTNEPPSSNRRPNLTTPDSYLITEGRLITFRAKAVDPDGDALTFSLDPGAPAGASIDPVTGTFQWRPNAAAGPNSYTITLRCTDAGVPTLSATTSFSVDVIDSLPDAVLKIGATNVTAGGTSSVPLSIDTVVPLRAMEWVIEYPPGSLGNFVLQSPSIEVKTATLDNIEPGRLRVSLTLDPGAGFTGPRRLIRLGFQGEPTAESGVQILQPREARMTTTAGTTKDRAAYQAGSVALFAGQPVLQVVDGATTSFMLYGRSGAKYSLETNGELARTGWIQLREISIPQGASFIGFTVPTAESVGFLRVVEIAR